MIEVDGAASVAPSFNTMKRHVYGNHPWLQKWVEEYHLDNIMKDDLAGIERFHWLMFTKASFKATNTIYDLFKSYFESYGIIVTKNKQERLVFHLDKKMIAWITLHK